MTHLSVPDERKQALGITDNLVRVSIGVEDADDLIADFDQALGAVPTGSAAEPAPADRVEASS
jgi:methionine-gamma-lyase